jgi:hypothetical protein
VRILADIVRIEMKFCRLFEGSPSVRNLVEIHVVNSHKARMAGEEMSQNGDGKIIVLFGSAKEINMKNKASLA